MHQSQLYETPTGIKDCLSLNNYLHSSKVRSRSRWKCAVSHISVQLTHKAAEVVVLEEFGKQISSKLCWLPYHETATQLTYYCTSEPGKKTS